MDFEIALMRQDEMQEVRSLMEQCFPKAYWHIFFIKPSYTLVARADGKIVGGMNMDLFTLPNKRKVGYLGWLYTAGGYRGNGIGEALSQKAIAFLTEQKATDVVACIEGDNGSSMGVFASMGFSIMPLRSQITRFGIGMLKVNKRASRFFDMGYFLWHLQIPAEFHQDDSAQRSFITTAFLSILAWIPSITGWNLLHYLFPSLMPDASGDWLAQKYSVILLLIPLFSLAIRTLSMKLSARVQNVDVRFLGWDVAWLAGFLLPLLTGIPFPVPGNIYINGYRWHNSDMDGALCKLARTEQLALAFFCLLLKGSIALRYTYTLLLLDSLFFFYPFSGYNANRVKKRGAAAFVTPMVMVIVTSLILFL